MGTSVPGAEQKTTIDITEPPLKDYFRLLSSRQIGYTLVMSSTDSPNGQAKPTAPVNHRLVRIRSGQSPLINNSQGKSQEKAVTPARVLDERLEERDMMARVTVSLESSTEKIADFKMERLLPEAKREENRWIAIKAINDLIEAACQATVLKLEAKLGTAPQREPAGEDEHGTLSEAEVFPRV